MSILTWILLGLFAGFIANRFIMHSSDGIIGDMILGVIGAIVGGWVFHLAGETGVTGFNVWSVFVASVGAVLVIFVYHRLPYVRRRHHHD